MATSSSGAQRSATTTRKTATRKPATARSRKPARSTTTSTQPKTRVEQAQQIAERAVLVPVGASLLARDNLVSTARDLASRYSTLSSVEREIKRYERRGATARNRVEREMRRTRTRFERELRQRRTRLERSVRQNRRRFEREVRSVRRDLQRQSGVVGTRVEKIVSNAQELISSAS